MRKDDYLKMKNLFFKTLNLKATDKLALHRFARNTGIPLERLTYYNQNNILPSGRDLKDICEAAGITKLELMLKMGLLDSGLCALIQKNADKIFDIITHSPEKNLEIPPHPPLILETEKGKLYQGDCIALMQNMDCDSIDLVFADPPFNLSKLYPSNIDDNLKSDQYLRWCENWMDECIRILKPGGSFFIWNLPKWNTHLSGFLNRRMTFRHWIAVDIKYSPSH